MRLPRGDGQDHHRPGGSAAPGPLRGVQRAARRHRLSVGRIVCRLTAPADLTRSATVGIEDGWDGAGIGWHELTAVGVDVSLRNSPVPASSVSDALRRYPDNLLSSPLDQRSATIAVTPGSDAVLPVLTALLVLVVGIGLVLRALAGTV